MYTGIDTFNYLNTLYGLKIYSIISYNKLNILYVVNILYIKNYFYVKIILNF